MKFGKNLARVVELSDPEWAPFWVNYKHLKKSIKDIVKEEGAASRDQQRPSDPTTMSQSPSEVAFFTLLKAELRKVAEFYLKAEQQFEIRKERVREGCRQLTQHADLADAKAWTRLLEACVRFYKELLLLENFAIMNYCGFSKILKKHDKCTGFQTRDAFMTHVVSREEFTHYPSVLRMLEEAEEMFQEIQHMQSRAPPLQEEERLFIEAIRTLNAQASKLQAAESQDVGDITSDTALRDENGGKDPDTGPLPSAEAKRTAHCAKAAKQAEAVPHIFNKAAKLFPTSVADAQDASDDIDAGLDVATTEATAAAIRVHYQYHHPTELSRVRLPGAGEFGPDEPATLERTALSISSDSMMELQRLAAASTSKRPSFDAVADADARSKRTRT